MTERPHLIELTAEIVASFVSCNPLPAADLSQYASIDTIPRIYDSGQIVIYTLNGGPS